MTTILSAADENKKFSIIQICPILNEQQKIPAENRDEQQQEEQRLVNFADKFANGRCFFIKIVNIIPLIALAFCLMKNYFGMEIDSTPLRWLEGTIDYLPGGTFFRGWPICAIFMPLIAVISLAIHVKRGRRKEGNSTANKQTLVTLAISDFTVASILLPTLAIGICVLWSLCFDKSQQLLCWPEQPQTVYFDFDDIKYATLKFTAEQKQRLFIEFCLDLTALILMAMLLMTNLVLFFSIGALLSNAGFWPHNDCNQQQQMDAKYTRFWPVGFLQIALWASPLFYSPLLSPIGSFPLLITRGNLEAYFCAAFSFLNWLRFVHNIRFRSLNKENLQSNTTRKSLFFSDMVFDSILSAGIIAFLSTYQSFFQLAVFLHIAFLFYIGNLGQFDKWFWEKVEQEKRNYEEGNC